MIEIQSHFPIVLIMKNTLLYGFVSHPSPNPNPIPNLSRWETWFNWAKYPTQENNKKIWSKTIIDLPFFVISILQSLQNVNKLNLNWSQTHLWSKNPWKSSLKSIETHWIPLKSIEKKTKKMTKSKNTLKHIVTWEKGIFLSREATKNYSNTTFLGWWK